MFEQALEVLKTGELIAAPTDTVYGVICDANTPIAVEKLYAFKQRPASQPLQILVNSFEMAQQLAEFSPVAQKIAENFWPGALTMILPRKPDASISPTACGDQETIGLRWADSSIINQLIEQLAHPLAASSINRTGETALSDTSSIKQQFPELFTLEGKAGQTSSTIIQFDENHFTILREGHITKEQIESALI